MSIKTIFLKFRDKNSNYNKSLIYVIADILNKILPFLMLPVITYYLNPEDYGTLSVIESISGILAVFVGLGSQDLIQVYFFKKGPSALKKFIGNSIVISFFNSILFFFIFLLFSKFFKDFFGLEMIWLTYAVILTFCLFIIKICTSVLIAQGKSILFGKFQNLNTLTILITTIIFIVVFKWNWQGRIYSLVISGILFTIYSIFYLKKNELLEFKADYNNFLSDLKASIPILPYSLSFWLSNGALLLIMASLIGKEQTGIYSGAMRIALIISFITITLNRVWQPMIYDLLSRKNIDSDRTAVKRTYFYILIIIFSCISLLLFSDFIIDVALNKSYHGAKEFSRILIITVALQNIFSAPGGLLLYYERKKMLTLITMTSISIQYSLIYFTYLNGILNLRVIIYIQLIIALFSFIFASLMVKRITNLPWIVSSTETIK